MHSARLARTESRVGESDEPLWETAQPIESGRRIGASKGKLGEDHSIDGFTLVGKYHFIANGWLQPVPDPNADGWGVFFGRLERPASRFAVKVRNTSNQPAAIRFRLDSEGLSTSAIIGPLEEKEVKWAIERKPGPVRVELVGDQNLVITETRFE